VATTPELVRFSTYNTLDLFAGDPDGAAEHYRQVVAVVRSLDPDVLAVQEIRAPDGPAAREHLRQLAADTGLRCLAEPAGGGEPEPALGVGSRGFHVGLLWREGIEPVPGSFGAANREFWHALAWVTLDVGGPAVRHAVYHAPPFCKKIREDQNGCLVATLARPDSRVPTLAGADWNGESADRVRDESGAWRLYEPRDPYAAAEWFEDLVHQCEWDYDERGRRRHWVDRGAGEVLWAGGLHDAAAVLRAPWQATAGHHPADAYGVRGVRRRIDAIRVTREVIPALRAHWVTDTDVTRRVSDHLPVTVEYAPAAIEAPPGAGAAMAR
jgi:endonuclease/exonuclease/phosphatase family metal-dependent hydrolase